jgi:hypothetical protein
VFGGSGPGPSQSLALLKHWVYLVPSAATTAHIGVPFVNARFTASARSRTEFPGADHIRESSSSAEARRALQPRMATARSVRRMLKPLVRFFFLRLPLVGLQSIRCRQAGCGSACEEPLGERVLRQYLCSRRVASSRSESWSMGFFRAAWHRNTRPESKSGSGHGPSICSIDCMVGERGRPSETGIRLCSYFFFSSASASAAACFPIFSPHS